MSVFFNPWFCSSFKVFFSFFRYVGSKNFKLSDNESGSNYFFADRVQRKYLPKHYSDTNLY